MLWSVIVAAAISACASQQAQVPAQQPATGGDAAAQVQKQEQQTTGAAKIDGEGIKLYKDRAGYDAKTQISLVDALKLTGKKVGIIQFAGVECTECIDTSLAIEKAIKASPKGKDMIHIMVVTDFFRDYTDAEFKAALAKMAPEALPVFDEAKVWKKYITDPKAPRATVIAMNLDQEATLSTAAGQELSIVPAAEKLVK
jgi:hypothetical protein